MPIPLEEQESCEERKSDIHCTHIEKRNRNIWIKRTWQQHANEI